MPNQALIVKHCSRQILKRNNKNIIVVIITYYDY